MYKAGEQIPIREFVFLLFCRLFFFTYHFLLLMLFLICSVQLAAVQVINFLHRIFFRNNLWILNPVSDRLIWLLEFFKQAAIYLGTLTGIFMTGLTVISVCVLHRSAAKGWEKTQ